MSLLILDCRQIPAQQGYPKEQMDHFYVTQRSAIFKKRKQIWAELVSGENEADARQRLPTTATQRQSSSVTKLRRDQ